MSAYRTAKKYLGVTQIIFIAALYILSTHMAWAVEPVVYKPFIEIPGLDYGTADFGSIVNQLYTLLVVVGSLFAVIKIAYSGVVYSLSDKVGSKESATHDIQGVLLGLALLLIPYIVLNTINSELTKLDIFDNGFGTIDLGAPVSKKAVTWDPNADLKTLASESQISCQKNPDAVWVNYYYGEGTTQTGPKQCAPKSRIEGVPDCTLVEPGVYNCTNRTRPTGTFSVHEKEKVDGCILGLSTQVSLEGYVSCADDGSKPSVVNTGKLLDDSEAARTLCMHDGGVIQKASSPTNQFNCISKPERPTSCTPTNAVCLEKCALAGGKLGQDQGGYLPCLP